MELRIHKLLVSAFAMDTGHSETSRGVPQSLQAAARAVSQINNIFLYPTYINMQYEVFSGPVC
jgi:hypothetical protein